MLDNRLFKNKSISDITDEIDHKTNYLKPVERDKYALASEFEIPDRKVDIP